MQHNIVSHTKINLGEYRSLGPHNSGNQLSNININKYKDLNYYISLPESILTIPCTFDYLKEQNLTREFWSNNIYRPAVKLVEQYCGHTTHQAPYYYNIKLRLEPSDLLIFQNAITELTNKTLLSFGIPTIPHNNTNSYFPNPYFLIDNLKAIDNVLISKERDYFNPLTTHIIDKYRSVNMQHYLGVNEIMTKDCTLLLEAIDKNNIAETFSYQVNRGFVFQLENNFAICCAVDYLQTDEIFAACYYRNRQLENKRFFIDLSIIKQVFAVLESSFINKH